MKKKVLKFKEKTGDLPEIGIIFCGNRAVVTARYQTEFPKFHEDVFYGWFFFLRLGIACAKVYYKI